MAGYFQKSRSTKRKKGEVFVLVEWGRNKKKIGVTVNAINGHTATEQDRSTFTRSVCGDYQISRKP